MSLSQFESLSFRQTRKICIYIYILVMSLLRVWMDPWIPGSLVVKTHFPNPPMGVQYLVGTVSAKKIDP